MPCATPCYGHVATYYNTFRYFVFAMPNATPYCRRLRYSAMLRAVRRAAYFIMLLCHGALRYYATLLCLLLPKLRHTAYATAARLR